MEAAPIVIFGGTFDPIHEGHISAIRFALRTYPSCTLAPTTQNPWKAEAPTELSLRIQMMELVLRAEGLPEASSPDLPGISIENFRYQFAKDLVLHLHGQYPQRKLLWLVGADTSSSVKKWRDWESLHVGLVVAPITINIHAIDIRAGGAQIHPAIRNFIASHGLYGAKLPS